MNIIEQKILNYPWSVDKIKIKGITYTTIEFVKMVIKYESGVNLARHLKCNNVSIVSKIKQFPELPRDSRILGNKFLSVIGYKYCCKCREPTPKEALISSGYCRNCKKELNKDWDQSNKQKKKDYALNYYKSNPEKCKALAAKYRAAKLQRMPKWADEYEIGLFYSDCPEGYHVDHIIPLQGKLVSGLHVPENLQYLLAEENLAKGNRYDITEKVNLE